MRDNVTAIYPRNNQLMIAFFSFSLSGQGKADEKESDSHFNMTNDEIVESNYTTLCIFLLIHCQ